MQDGHAVPHDRSNSATAARRSSGDDGHPGAHVAGRLDEHEADPPAAALLVARGGGDDVGRVDRRVEPRRQPVLGEQVGDLLAQRGLGGERERRQQPEPDRLAVAVARVARDGLDRVPDRVAEVEALAARRRRARRRPRRRASCARTPARGRGRPRAAPRADALPQRPAGDQRGLDHLGPARGELLRRQRGERARVGEHGRAAGGRRRRSSCPAAGPRRSCRRRRSRPGPPASSAPAPPARRAGRRPRRSRPGRRRRRRRARSRARRGRARPRPAPRAPSRRSRSVLAVSPGAIVDARDAPRTASP